jgi:hypothetical protein
MTNDGKCTQSTSHWLSSCPLHGTGHIHTPTMKRDGPESWSPERSAPGRKLLSLHCIFACHQRYDFFCDGLKAACLLNLACDATWLVLIFKHMMLGVLSDVFHSKRPIIFTLCLDNLQDQGRSCEHEHVLDKVPGLCECSLFLCDWIPRSGCEG